MKINHFYLLFVGPFQRWYTTCNVGIKTSVLICKYILGFTIDSSFQWTNNIINITSNKLRSAAYSICAFYKLHTQDFLSNVYENINIIIVYTYMQTLCM